MSTSNSSLPLRSEVPVALTWDLTQVYKAQADWQADFERVEALIPKLAAYKGRIRRSGRILLEALTARDQLGQIFGKLSIYARLHADADTADQFYQGLVGKLKGLGSRYGTAMSWMTPELLSIKPAQLAKFTAKHPGLELYARQFAELDRERAHVHGPEVSRILALVSPTNGGPASIFGMFNNADLKFPTIKDENGNDVQVTHGNYSRMLDSPKASVREAAFRAVFGTYMNWRNTLAASYVAQVKQDVSSARIANYSSSRAAAMESIEVPESVYDTLIATVDKNLDKLQRYLRLRKELLGVDTLNPWDLYVPLVADVDYKVSFEEAQEIVLASLAPLGSEYVETLRQGYKDRWVDVVENKGKRAGAYSSGTFGTPPYMLLNWQGDLGSVFTFAHESGHSMHSHLTRTHQPYPYAGYTLFVAEVASTLNEALLAHHLLATTKDPKVRMFIINEQLEHFRATLYRQVLFAEFEKITHEKEEAGEALTADVLSEIHLGLNRKYYGSEVVIDPLLAIEWARIPHFYRAFYVYQYATGISAATALAKQILTEGAPAVERYLGFLKGGSSKDSLSLLQGAGVDLSTSEPIQAALDTFGEYLDQFEALVKAKA